MSIVFSFFVTLSLYQWPATGQNIIFWDLTLHFGDIWRDRVETGGGGSATCQSETPAATEMVGIVSKM
jgi:hypothetical protein